MDCKSKISSASKTRIHLQLAKLIEKFRAKASKASMAQSLIKKVNKIERIEIDPEVVDAEDIETLQDLILAAVNEGLRQSQKNMQNSLGQQIGKMTGGIDFSNLLNPKS